MSTQSKQHQGPGGVHKPSDTHQHQSVSRRRKIFAVASFGVVVTGICLWWSTRSTESPRDGQVAAVVSTPGPTRDKTENSPSLPTLPARSWAELDNPASDGWTTEVTSEQVNKVLKQLGSLLTESERIDAEHLQRFAHPQFICDSLLPQSLQTVFEDQDLQVKRAAIEALAVQQKTRGRFSGAEGMAEALRLLAAPYADATESSFKFKVFHVATLPDAFVTRQYFSAFGSTPAGRLEQNSEWEIRWSMADDGQDKLPRLKQIRVVQFEQATLRRTDGPLFRDCTESVLGQNASYRDQLLLGMNHWLERIQDTRYFSTLGNPGLAVGDVNGDGLDDLYVCQEAHLPNRLFLQRADGTAEDVSHDWGIDWLENSRSALLVDLDNDADQDLVVAIQGALVVAANDSNRKFEIRSVLPTDDDTMSLTAADYDNDGDLDIYVCVDYSNDIFAKNRELSVLGGASNRVYHDSNNAGRNSLYRNDISTENEWRFTNVTSDVGLDVNNRRFSFASAWDDFDDDGDQDLYVANDFGRNNLYRNDISQPGQGTFNDVASRANTEDSASGMSAAWGDFDRDGRMDIFVGNMFSAAGGRITHHAQFKSDATEEVKSRLRRFARGSTLLRNRGDGTFSDFSEDAAVTVGRWAWSSDFVDINNDGWQDFVVANGYITADDTGDL